MTYKARFSSIFIKKMKRIPDNTRHRIINVILISDIIILFSNRFG